jgi:hypothetical protein
MREPTGSGLTMTMYSCVDVLGGLYITFVTGFDIVECR